jgi:AP2 domain.
MTSLAVIEEFLNVETGAKKLCDGKHKANKNQYYYFRDRYYIVSVAGDRWFIMSDCRRTRQLLRGYSWCANSKMYIVNGKEQLLIHREVTRCEDDLVVDHINRRPYDNRVDNLRTVTSTVNKQNNSKYKNNTSGKQGVSKYHMNGIDYWVAHIRTGQRRIQKYFNIAKFGKEGSYAMAVESRKDLELEFGFIGE